MSESAFDTAVALIGMSGRFPGAATVAELWHNLRTGVPGLREITHDELADAGVPSELSGDPGYVRVGGAVPDIDRFDATMFGLNPREAETMDPQHRLFLECSWEALEAAGYCPVDVPGQVGVYGGCAFPDYMVQNVSGLIGEPGGVLLLAVGNERDSLTSFVSYKLGLTGPSMTVQSFCSTSLVAVHLACQGLLTYDCDMALAGGAFLPLPQPAGYLYTEGGILSPDGIVRSFDAKANGTVMAPGVGVVALKRMNDALADGDVIHAVILGSAVSNDGRDRVGYTAPGVDGQARVIESALAAADVNPDSVGYVECHATGTMLGDSIELAAMNRVFGPDPRTPCVLGTIKPMLGHLDRAAGVAGLIRATLALEHRVLPGTPHHTKPNPVLAAAGDRFTVLAGDQPWPAGTDPRRAGVSSFGLGGTNAHVVLQEAPPRQAGVPRTGPHLLTMSAADPAALDELTARLRDHLTAHQDTDLADVAFTLQESRGYFALRRAVVCADLDDAVAALADPARWIDGRTDRRDPRLHLVTPADPPADWCAELVSAAGELLGAAVAGVPPTGVGAAAAVTDGLTRLGIRIGSTPDAVEVALSPDGAPAVDWLAGTLARLWLAGATIDWAALHHGMGRRVELPTYPFQRRHYWVKAAPADRDAQATGRCADPSRWTYLPTWFEHPLPLTDLDARLRAAGPWLVFTADPRGDALVQRLRDAGAEVTTVRPGATFDATDSGEFAVRPGEPSDHEDLLRSQVPPRTIIHGFALRGTGSAADAIDTFEAAQEYGFYSALALAAALATDPGAEPTELILLTGGAVGVVGPDLTDPEHATLVGLAPSLSQENPHLRCRTVDVGDVTAPADVDRTLAAMIAPFEGPVAVRAGEAWLRGYRSLPLAAPETGPIRSGDTVLITGGLGDVGLVLARHLAAGRDCRLVLTVRSPLPPREEWPAFLAAVPEGADRTARHIRNVLDLEARGAQVLAVSADAADAEAMREVVRAADSVFGGVDVVVHGAGVQNEQFFDLAHRMDRAACQAHLRAKAAGFLALEAALSILPAGRRPHRLITLSSLSAVLGGIALGPYSAANAALDAYVRTARLRGTPWITVDWDTWAIDPARLAQGPTAGTFAMTPEEGIAVFERALAAVDHVGHAVISTGPLADRIAQWVTGDLAAPGTVDDDRERYPRPDLMTPYAEPADETEAAIADIWAAVLGLETVGIDDDFFELGGHSLIAIQLASRIGSALGVRLPVTALVEQPTVRRLGAIIRIATPNHEAATPA
ncbi:SDR family NAD(P)-dependent oxidoreductase [Sphaerisporangium album]|uniref:SDR family NAD(P)-dependent oxidoreductase n=1 Tax=Sphaerisporangium album TaxID=509200 RepID=A0A367F7Z8_9ACTN|nr:SDR family NAD(P)-dependent oxidoreductase [Sphaerisporangium album]RCG26488.1 SDR family NAD(P)-dependent oxidoreductase [Sphaerisporangium album]